MRGSTSQWNYIASCVVCLMTALICMSCSVSEYRILCTTIYFILKLNYLLFDNSKQNEHVWKPLSSKLCFPTNKYFSIQISDFIPMFDDQDQNEEKYSLQILKCFPEFNQVVGETQLLQCWTYWKAWRLSVDKWCCDFLNNLTVKFKELYLK